MRMMDEEHLKRPHRGWRQMVDFLDDQGLKVNRKRIQRLMQTMGIEGISPKRRTTLRSNRTPEPFGLGWLTTF
jgi:putative transposase